MKTTHAIFLLLVLGGCHSDGLSSDRTDDLAIRDATPDAAEVVCTSQTDDPAVCSAQPGCKQFQCPGCSSGSTYPFCAPASSSPDTVCPPLGCPIEIDCKTLPGLVSNYIAGNAECKTAADCVLVTTDCGLPAACGAYINANAASGIQSYNADWENGSCAPGCVAPPCGAPQAPQCIGGQCM